MVLVKDAAWVARKRARLARFNGFIASLHERDTSDPTFRVCPTGLTPMRFTLPDPGHRLVVAALYPPAGSSIDAQHDNVTSTILATALGHTAFDWIDVFPHAPKSNSSLDQKALYNLLDKDPTYAKTWLAHIEARVQANFESGSGLPVVYVAGKTCADNWTKHGPKLQRICDDVAQCTTASGVVYVVVFRPHPSAHMVSGGRPQDVEVFRETATLLKALHSLDSADLTELPSLLAKNASLWKHGEREIKQLLGIKTWPKRLMSMRFRPFELCSVRQAYIDLLQHVASPGQAFTLLSTCGVSARLGTNGTFTDTVMDLLTRFGIGKTTTLVGTDGVASRLTQEDFWLRVNGLISEHGIGKTTTLVGMDGVASRLMQEDFWLRVSGLISEYGIELCNSFMSDQVAVRLLGCEIFGSFVANMVNQHGFAKLAKAMTGPWAVKISRSSDHRAAFETMLL